jgi:DNA-directed RNA polymerase subunit E'/Rpb7
MTEISDLYIDTLVQYKININPIYLTNTYTEFILSQLKYELEGKCIKEGFVKKDSAAIVKKSVGYINNSNFTGDITFNVICSVNVCNPLINSIIKCKINNINQLGFLSHIGPLSIIVPKELHNNKKLFKNLSVDDEVYVKIVNKKFELNDTEISVIGRINEDTKTIKVKQYKQTKKT